jgi:hypothetical protein
MNTERIVVLTIASGTGGVGVDVVRHGLANPTTTQK